MSSDGIYRHLPQANFCLDKYISENEPKKLVSWTNMNEGIKQKLIHPSVCCLSFDQSQICPFVLVVLPQG